jgi:RNA polymerase sigma factor (sigma-70 family)
MPGLRGPSALLRLQSDEKLIALTRDGQHAAFETLCARYQSRLLAFCRHMLGSREDAEDVLQEVFAAAFNAILADERAINVRPWLYRIARNRSLNHLRRASAIGVDSMDVHFSDNGLSTGDRVLRRESFRELIADVQHLPETQRTALLLREIDALSYEQIAQAMETTVPSVKSLLVRARISLAEAAEARRLSCEDVRLELGEAAEGLHKLTTAARRHVRTCERCSFFKKQLHTNNRALAAIFPVGPIFLLKKLLLAKLGSTASAGGAHVAGGAGATVGAGASATVGAGAVAGAGSAGGAGIAGGVLTAGAGAVATKAVAGLAAAAIVTAGAVAADHTVTTHHRHPAAAAASAAAVPVRHYETEPVVVSSRPQPVTNAGSVRRAFIATSKPKHSAKALKTLATTPAAAVAKPGVPAATPVATTPVPGPPAPATTPAKAPAQPTGTQVTEETTQLPASATKEPASGEATATTPAPDTTTTGPATETNPAPATPPATTTTGTTPAPSTSTDTTQSSLPTAEAVPAPDPVVKHSQRARFVTGNGGTAAPGSGEHTRRGPARPRKG